MENDKINSIFEDLQRLGQCRTRDEFSREWLGREKSYYRSLISKGRTASAEAQINLAGCLRKLGTHNVRSTNEMLREMGATYLQLYAELIDGLLAGARPQGSVLH